MLNIEIKGVQFSNKGAELMLQAILQQLDTHIGEYQLTLSPGRNLPYIKRAKLGAWQKLSFRRGDLDLTGVLAKSPKALKRFLKRYGIVTEADVDVVLNASGFAYGDQWPLSDLRNTAKEIKRFKALGKPYIVLPQALGPFERKELHADARTLINDTAITFARDDKSFEACKALDIANNLKQSPDFTSLLDVEKLQPFTSKTVCLIPNNKVISDFHSKFAVTKRGEYLAFWKHVVDFFAAQGFKIIVLNHEGDEDLEICEYILKTANVPNIELINGLNALEIKQLLGRCSAVISSRFHGCVSALCQGVPCLATSWSHKYETLYAEYKLPQNILDFTRNSDELEKKLNLFVNDLTNQAHSVLQHADRVKEENRKMWQQVVTIIKS